MLVVAATKLFQNFNVHHFVVTVWQHHPLVRSSIGALVLGGIGGGAYVTAVLLGFLGSDTLEQFRARFTVFTPPPQPARQVLSRARLGVFIFFGAAVAFVFQLAQGKTFAPIQAFVLGATWTTVVAQMISNSAQGDMKKNQELAQAIRGLDTAG